MICLSDVTLPPQTDFSDLPGLVAQITGWKREQIRSCRLQRRSVDARKKPRVVYSCTFLAEGENESAMVRHCKIKNVRLADLPAEWSPQIPAGLTKQPVVVVGSGPAGLFAALILARAGLCPTVLERGQDVDTRLRQVKTFWQTGALDTDSNVQFGEGGAGTFSDGKLNTGTKDPRNRFVLREFAAHGAPAEILFEARPHVGTDRLVAVVKALRKEIESLGGRVVFGCRFTGMRTRDGRVTAAVALRNGQEELFPCRGLILALGHSARDTVTALWEAGLPMEQKPFSVGVRMEHPQSAIDLSQYGMPRGDLPPADYRLSLHLPTGRGVYTFCMCPGGQVVAAASQTGGVCTNGMSLFARDGRNANSALLVGVGTADFESDHPLAGMAYQRRIEQTAFSAAGGDYKAPCQRVEDFLAGRPSTGPGTVLPTYMPGVVYGQTEDYLPAPICDSLRQALPLLGRKLKGFDGPDALMTGPETRSSSPVRMVRDGTCQSAVGGVFPCGEGAGYAGGIVSAAVDGIRVAEAVMENLSRG